jgi:hypothetical protein
VARHPGTSLQMFRVHNEVAGSGDVVIRKQGISTVDTRVPAIATTLSSFSYLGRRTPRQGDIDLDIRPHRNRILLRGRHLGGRRLLTPDLHRIESASSRWEMMSLHNKRLTSIVWMCEIVCHQHASLRNPDLLGSMAHGGWSLEYGVRA